MHTADASKRSACDHRAWSRGWLAEIGGQIWPEEISGRFGDGDSAGRGRISGSGVDSGVLGGGSGPAARRRSGSEGVFAERSSAASGRNFSQPGFGVVATANCGARTRRILQGRDLEENPGDDEAAWRDDDRGRSRRVFQRICRTDFDDVPRLDGLRDAAERAGNRRAGNVEYHGDVSDGAVRVRVGKSAARDDRSQEAGLRGLGEIYRRSRSEEHTSELQ